MINKIFNNKWVQYVLISLLFFVVLYKVKITGGDDEFYRTIIHNRNVLDWVNELYQTWSGRIILTSIQVLMVNLPNIIWKLINTLILTALVYVIEKLTIESNWVRLSSVALILLIPTPILNSSAFWVTGSLNYLWPTVAMLWVVYYFSKISSHQVLSKIEWSSLYLLSIYASNNEQTGLILLTLFLILFIYRSVELKKIELKMITYLFVLLGSYLVLILAPGNSLRFTSEMISLKPSFLMLDGFDKVTLGLSYAFEIFLNPFKFLLFILSSLLVMISYRKSKSVFVVALYGLLYLLFKFLMDYIIKTYPFCTQCNDLHYLFFTFKYIALNYNENFMIYLPNIFALSYLISVALVLFHLEFESYNKRSIIALLWLGTFMSAVILGFSPTIEASGHRIFFVLSIGLVLSLAYVIGLVSKEKVFQPFLFALIVILAYEAIQLAFMYYNVFDFTVVY